MDHSMLPEPLNTELANLMDELQRPPSGDELAGGWQPALKTRWADWFVVLRNNLEAGEETPPGWGILRAMDFDGVSDTPLAKRASRIGRLVDEWKSAR
ncbi:hypothetical protein [Brevundimonas sp. UBA1471]|jgi:hypothetical protein|uniref:hypothetical protein n=2 Tax=Caulobacteraceae TaxID=76892 RepID=UPI00257A5D03|nr:hypothetical protein [Brevundimonas sp. UBA1471]|tara:strand:+ start:8075 stop:8368 length:294 start_codon:yes stop_codon:yes gene_type:complete